MKKNAKPGRLVILVCLLSVINSIPADAQKHPSNNDTSYYETLWNHVTARIFMAQKYTHFTIPSSGNIGDLQYVANPKLNLGIGATWHNFSINAFYGLKYLNNNDSVKGKTKGLDLQVSLFPRKWVIDLYVVMPKGMHLNPMGYATTNPNKYYYRADVKERIFGFSMLRAPNKQKFSYRAALVNNEWQKKSAGSLLYGLHGYYLIMESNNPDSLLVPKMVQSSFPKIAGVTESRFITAGPIGGYAYTLVLQKHFFLMTSVVLGLNLNIMTEEHGELDWRKNTALAGTFEYKAALGYNSPNWSFRVSGTGNNFWAKGVSTQKYNVMGGQLRFAVSKKFDTKKKHHTS